MNLVRMGDRHSSLRLVCEQTLCIECMTDPSNAFQTSPQSPGQSPCINDTIDCRKDVLTPSQLVRHRRAAQQTSRVHVPKRPTVVRVQYEQIARNITRNKKMSSGSKDARVRSAFTFVSRPANFSSFIIYRNKKRARP